MAASAESRYTQAERIFVEAPVYDRFGQPVMVNRYTRRTERRDTAYLYTLYFGNTLPPGTLMNREGQGFQEHAWKALHDPRKWWVVADFNPHIRHPFDLKQGDLINVPV